MKKYIIAYMSFLVFGPLVNAQSGEQSPDRVKLEQTAEETHARELKEKQKAEKEMRRTEKELKKVEKEVKKREKLTDAVRSKRKSVDKNEKKLIRLREKMELDKVKGKLSPNDIAKTNKKIEKLRSSLANDIEKLRKLERKQ